MKKTILSFFVVAAFLAVTIFSSCEKIEVASPVVVNDSLVGTITGVVHAELDEQHPDNNQVTEKAPSGTKVFLQIELSELNTQAPDGEYTIFSTTVDANGNYTFSDVPTSAKGVNGTIILDEFTYDRTVWSWDADAADWVSSTERTVFNSVEAPVFVVYGQKVVQDMSY